MEIKFIKMNPTQNMTILVESDVAPEKRLEIGTRLINHDSVGAEQIGYITKPNSSKAWARLDMLAGEFCGNGSMSLAAFLAIEKGITTDQVIPLEVSGMTGILECFVRPKDDHYLCTVKMPTPKGVEKANLSLDNNFYELWAADMNGITHVIVPENLIKGDKKAFAEKAIKVWQKVFNTEAFGVMLYDFEQSRLTPLVYIEPADTLIWENGCGSGSAAIGCCFATEKAQSLSLPINQPGGEIIVEPIYAGSIVSEVSITGQVRMSARGIAYLS